MRLINLEREEGKVKLSRELQRELTQAVVHYSNYLKDQIYNEKDQARKQQLRERLFNTMKLYYIFEQPSVRVRTGPEFYHNWEKFSKELVKGKLQFG